MTMKTLSAVALCLSVVPGFAFAQSPETGPHGCSLATLDGQYLANATGTVFPPAFGVTQQAISNVAGYSLYFGDGTGEDHVTQTINGVKVPTGSPVKVTYTLNTDCTGTKTIMNGPEFDIYVAVDGSALTTVGTSAPPNHSSGFAVAARQERVNAGH